MRLLQTVGWRYERCYKLSGRGMRLLQTVGWRYERCYKLSGGGMRCVTNCRVEL
ncbi:hypothetical protein Leryth_011629 [Lithospermum erythrorhizon]|nr:hypothetical protein Leryth_011629 [Lithospermum erythrorhizon]